MAPPAGFFLSATLRLPPAEFFLFSAPAARFLSLPRACVRPAFLPARPVSARRNFFIPTPKKRLHFINKADKQHSVAVLAQLVEQRIRNAWVGGSSPLNGTIFLSAFSPPDNIFRHFLLFC